MLPKEGPWIWPVWLFYLIIRPRWSFAGASAVRECCRKILAKREKMRTYKSELEDLDVRKTNAFRVGKECME